jgi:hypothetical protein
MDAPSEWWRTFFAGPAVDSWLMATTAEQSRSEADFIQDALGVAPPARLYTCREVLALMANAGFGDVETFGSFAREPFRLGSHRLLAVATRRGPGA